VLTSRSGTSDYLDVPVFHYMMGNALLFKLDPDCIVYFQRFLSKNRGRIYIKDAFQKMSLFYYATGDQERADQYRSKILKFGSTLTDADKQAQRFAQNQIKPDAGLLKARLYSDGGYFDKALDLFAAMHEEDYTSDADRLEFRYRYGKIYQLTGQDDKAIPLLESAVKLGANRPEQFGARAALELGQIYEARGQRSKAIEYYKQCVNMKDHDFEGSLEQKAKAGINRLGGN
jgi:tetratricopeptide (TPR) repeat protein